MDLGIAGKTAFLAASVHVLGYVYRLTEVMED